MADLASYTLASLRSDLLREFGLSSSTSNDQLANDKINEAIHWINRRRSTWPWLISRLVVNVAAKDSATLTFTNGSNTATLTSGSVSVRQKLVPSGSQANESDAYMVTAVSGSTVTLDANYRGSSGSASVDVYTDSYQLPDDLHRIIDLWDVALVNRPYKFLDPQTFDKRRATGLHLISGNVYYTVTNDPVPATDDTVEPKAYLQIYPYPASTTTLRGLYRKQEEDLVADGDIPVIPREHRLALLYIAEWLLAVKLKQPPDVVRNYETKAQSAIVELDKMYTFSEEDPEDLTLQRADVFGPLEYDFPI